MSNRYRSPPPEGPEKFRFVVKKGGRFCCYKQLRYAGCCCTPLKK